MCLIAIAIGQHPRWPLVIAANRDEFLQRPSAALDWWHDEGGALPWLGGRDLHAGGTWMALNTQGRIAMLTNVRDLDRHVPTAPSRGAIVPAWLTTRASADDFWPGIASRGCNPFNLLAGDMTSGRWWWADDRAKAPLALQTGLFGLSNAALDTPWPKVQRLKAALAAALEGSASGTAIESALFAALADANAPPDDTLPDTGIGIERERRLGAAFIRMPDGRYGTRSSSLLLVESSGTTARLRMVERQFDADGTPITQRGSTPAAWPLAGNTLPAVQLEAISAS